jgi:hypothetical protein
MPRPWCHSRTGARMHRPCRVAINVVMEILGSGAKDSPDPRRNTSKEFFETSPSGDKAETCIRFVSTLSPLLVVFMGEVDTKRRQGGDMSPLSEDLSSINCE